MSPALCPARQALLIHRLCAARAYPIASSYARARLRRLSSAAATEQLPEEQGLLGRSSLTSPEDGESAANTPRPKDAERALIPVRRVVCTTQHPAPTRKTASKDGERVRVRKVRSDLTPQSFKPADPEVLQEARRRRDTSRLRSRTMKGLLNFKGDWSYDWRVALKMLVVEQAKAREWTSRTNTTTEAETPSPPPKSYRDVHVRDIPRPEEWTMVNFLGYTRALADSRVSLSKQRIIYADGPDHRLHPSQAHCFQVQRMLHSLLTDESLRGFLSTAACEAAMDFFLRHNMLGSARKVLAVMSPEHVPISTSTFNRILWSTAFHSDLRNFTMFLTLMGELAIPIDNSTWCAFLHAVEAKEVKLRVFREMQQQGILEDAEALRTAVAELVDQELREPFTSMADIAPFLEHMDRKYGAAWLSEKSGAIICDMLCGHNQFSQVPKMLELMASRDQGPGAPTMTALLKNAAHAGDPAWALHIVELFRSRFQVPANSGHLDLIFQLGVRTRGYNLCRVAWHCACAQGWATRDMRRFVQDSLMRNTPRDARDAAAQWPKHAGKVVCGVGLRRDDPRLAALREWVEGGEARAAQVAAAKDLVARDTLARAAPRFRPDFARLMRLAVERDCNWVRSGEDATMPLEAKMRGAIEVPLRSQARAREAQAERVV